MKEEVRLLVLSPDSQYSPSYLARTASSLEYNVFIKQTCYGILVEGEKKEVEKVIKEVRKIDPNRIFSKRRAFPLGDKRRCRAVRGSARPGFYFLQKEVSLLPFVSKSLENLEDIDAKEVIKTKKLTPVKLQKIVEETR
ncbi:MAG: methanogenesis marker 6 protein [Candidatus Methanofastidiosia archaeon]